MLESLSRPTPIIFKSCHKNGINPGGQWRISGCYQHGPFRTSSLCQQLSATRARPLPAWDSCWRMSNVLRSAVLRATNISYWNEPDQVQEKSLLLFSKCQLSASSTERRLLLTIYFPMLLLPNVVFQKVYDFHLIIQIIDKLVVLRS